MLIECQKLCLKHGLQEEYCRALTNHYSAYFLGRLPNECIALTARCFDYCVNNDIDLFRRYALGYAASCHIMMGEWDVADEKIAMAIGDGGGNRLSRNPAVRAACQLAIRRGEKADSYLQELDEHASHGRERKRFRSNTLVAAEHYWTTGDETQNALQLMEDAWAAQTQDSEPWELAELWYWRRKLSGVDELPKYLPMPPPFVLLRQGKIAKAAELAEQRNLPFLAAIILAEGDEAQAQRAMRIFDLLGATATLERVRFELAGRGIRAGTRGPRKSTRENPHGLTKRELDVLALIDQGLTNKDIGERLFVSSKTVDHHVSSLLGKLGARNRSEAAAMGRAEGLV